MPPDRDQMDVRVKTAKTKLPAWPTSGGFPPPAASSSALKRVPPTPFRPIVGTENELDDPNPGPIGT